MSVCVVAADLLILVTLTYFLFLKTYFQIILHTYIYFILIDFILSIFMYVQEKQHKNNFYHLVIEKNI